MAVSRGFVCWDAPEGKQPGLCLLLGVGLCTCEPLVGLGLCVCEPLVGVGVCEPGGGFAYTRSTSPFLRVVGGSPRCDPFPERSCMAQGSVIGIVSVGVDVASSVSLVRDAHGEVPASVVFFLFDGLGWGRGGCTNPTL